MIYPRIAVYGIFFLSTMTFAQGNSLQRGLELFRQEHYEAALQQFQDANRAQRTSAVIENLIGITETKLGRIAEANAHYERAVRLDPALPGPHKNLAFNYLNAKQYALAEKHLRAASALDNSDEFVHYYLGILYLATEREQEAITQLAPAGSLFESDPETAFLMAKACLHFNASMKALKLIEALELGSGLSISQEYDLAQVLNEKQLYSASVQRFQRIAKMEPASWVSKYNLAIAFMDNKQLDEAIALLEPLAAERPRDANVLSLLGSAYESTSRLPRALDAYQNAVRLDPQNTNRYLDYTRLLMDMDRYDDAVKLVQEGLHDVQDVYALKIRLGVLLMREGKYGEARKALEDALAAHPEIVIGHVALAETYAKEGNDVDALKVLSTARAELPLDYVLEYIFGTVSIRLGQNEQALSALTNAVKLGPNVAQCHYELGKLYLQMGRLPESQAEFESVLRLAPDHANAHYQLSRIFGRLGETEKSSAMAEQTRQLIQTQREKAIKDQRSRLGGGFQPE